MSRRSGLGRGLAALIPPVPEQTPAPDEPTSVAGDAAIGAADAGPDDTDTPDAGVERSASSAAADDPGSGEQPTPAPSPGATTMIGADTATLTELSPASIVPNPRQPREVFDPDELEGLATSLRDVGVLQPLVVRPMQDGRYELIAGERRLRAAKLAGLPRVPVVVRHTDDTDLLKEALVENIHRVQLNPLEEAAAYQQLLEDFGVTQEELATRLGRSRPAITNALRLLALPPAVQRRVAAGVLSAGHAKALGAVGDAAEQTRLAERIVAEGLSVRATEELIRLRLTEEETAPRRRRTAVTAPGLDELQQDLSDALRARVRISMGTKKGRLAIEFQSVDDLERIVGIIAGGLDGREVATGELHGEVNPPDAAP